MDGAGCLRPIHERFESLGKLFGHVGLLSLLVAPEGFLDAVEHLNRPPLGDAI